MGVGRSSPAGAAARGRFRAWYEYRVRDPFFGSLYFALHYLFLILPIDLVSAFGGFFGWLTWKYRYQDAQARIRQWYAHLSAYRDEARAPDDAVRALFVQIGRVAAEFPTLHRLWAAGRITVAGAEHLLAPRRAGSPVIVIGVHTGNWEVIGPTLIGLGLRGFKGFYQPPPSRFVHKGLLLARRRYGAIPLRPGIAATRAALRHLAQDRGVFLIYCDEERGGSVCGPLFGRSVPPRSNIVTTVRLSWASGAVVIPAFVERLGGARFRTTFLPPIELLADQTEEALVGNVKRLDGVVAGMILPRLDQWYMLTRHRR